ncbi:low molecular weight protein-tyrosine-phosphatase [Simiduia agarivorans]|uniref:protein-tyrosine-phosphatase n=1 Tax=Simiduia agarivorans (strain DSM 21679 / JCM 13881 / BCRC 17597 / SA1) TaxID=1117647 RepID=K4KHR8_SIMAS|nr:low molecular weight protein-tyrosine-phosphatase [Simiduia agarivorans]AFU97518.1 protein tyrosine phosphatase [Simiduia agarivorans SA1 = DSM 21679]
MTRVLLVCLGNICRSPTAEGVLRARLAQAGLEHRVELDSAGTAGWHQGKSPDSRSQAAAARRGYDLSPLRARQVIAADFDHYDHIYAMDANNLADLRAICPAHAEGKLSLFLALIPGADCLEVPDPYYGGGEGFERVLDLCEQASDAFIAGFQRRHG